MNLSHLPAATRALYDGLVARMLLDEIMREVLEEFDVTEGAVRARFHQHYGQSPEEVLKQYAIDKSIERFLEDFREKNTNYHQSRTRFLGARFHLTNRDVKSDVEEKRWYRFLISHGQKVVIVDEITQRVGEVLDNETINEIARQIGWKRWAHW